MCCFRFLAQDDRATQACCLESLGYIQRSPVAASRDGLLRPVAVRLRVARQPGLLHLYHHGRLLCHLHLLRHLRLLLGLLLGLRQRARLRLRLRQRPWPWLRLGLRLGL